MNETGKQEKKQLRKQSSLFSKTLIFFSCVKNKCVFRAVLFHSTMR